MSKAAFIQAALIRILPDIDKANAVIDRAEALWAILELRGYADDGQDGKEPVEETAATPNSSGWDGLPAGFVPAPPRFSGHQEQIPLPQRSRPAAVNVNSPLYQARSDVSHWKKMADLTPDNPVIHHNLKNAEARLAEILADPGGG